MLNIVLQFKVLSIFSITFTKVAIEHFVKSKKIMIVMLSLESLRKLTL